MLLTGRCQVPVLYFGVQGLTFFNRGKQPIFSLVPRNSRQAGIKTRERGPDLQEKLTGIPESVQKFAVAEGMAGKLPASSIPILTLVLSTEQFSST